MGTDFFDDDLAQVDSSRAQDDREKKAAAEKPAAEAPAGRLARHKEELAARVSDSSNELERLRRRQEELGRQKAGLETAARKQEEYERGKRDIIEKLDRSLVLIEKEEVQATQMVELLSTMRQRFKETLAELRNIDEERWPQDGVAEELNKAEAIVEDAKEVYKKGLAKVDASRWQEGAKTSETLAYQRGADDMETRSGFGFWLKVGLAVTLPIVVVMIALFVVFVVLSR
jgi:hypothetical protein